MSYQALLYPPIRKTEAMKQVFITMTILIILFSSCSPKKEKKAITQNAKDLKIEKSEKQIEQTAVKDTISSEILEECGCYNGIGSSENSEPIMTFDFSNGKSVSVCGYKETGNKVTIRPDTYCLPFSSQLVLKQKLCA